MKKIAVLLVISLFILTPLISNISAENQPPDKNNFKVLKEQSFFSTAEITPDEEYLSINVKEAERYISTPGKPKLPVYTKTYYLPLGTKVKEVNCTAEDIVRTSLSKKIKPVPQPKPKMKISSSKKDNNQHSKIENTEVYSKDSFFPDDFFDYTIKVGLKNNERKVIVKVDFYPVLYNSNQNIIKQAKNVDIKVDYELPMNSLSEENEYDMVVIGPNKFYSAIKPLVTHKNNIGIKTIFKSTEAIYQNANDGKYDIEGENKPVDHQEMIKYFIKYAIENWNITYVLLIGGRQNQGLDWHVPARFSNLHDRDFWNDTYVTDLYYADIYKYNESSEQIEFDDWDSNNNNVIGEWTWIFENGWWYTQDKKDDLDLSPDIYLGRLACRNIIEVKSVVQKIIRYEKNSAKNDFFKRIILVGGDTFPYSDAVEGEVENELVGNYLEPLGFTTKKLWVSTGELSGPEDVVRELRKGAGFVFLSGHGTPLEWCTHPVDDKKTWVDVYALQMQFLLNRNKLPICVVGGCHNSQFDVTLSYILRGVREYGLKYFTWNLGIDCFQKWTWVPECWSWNLVSQRNDGFIAAIGNTGLGWGVPGENCVDYNEGYINTHFFQVYSDLSQEGINNLGIIHAETINDYIVSFTPNNNPIDRKTIEQWALLGDPSLEIGGYP